MDASVTWSIEKRQPGLGQDTNCGAGLVITCTPSTTVTPGMHIHNWDLSCLANGTYGVVVDLGDSAACGSGPRHAVVTVAKKGKT